MNSSTGTIEDLCAFQNSSKNIILTMKEVSYNIQKAFIISSWISTSKTHK